MFISLFLIFVGIFQHQYQILDHIIGDNRGLSSLMWSDILYHNRKKLRYSGDAYVACSKQDGESGDVAVMFPFFFQ